jgi:hypothetical protein
MFAWLGGKYQNSKGNNQQGDENEDKHGHRCYTSTE